MSAYKPFLSTDIIVSPLVVNKSFTFEGSGSFENNNILRLRGTNYNLTSSQFFNSASYVVFSSSISQDRKSTRLNSSHT